MHKEQQRVLLESEHGGFRLVWPFMVMETSHNEDHTASFNHANLDARLPFSEIRKEKHRALLEGKTWERPIRLALAI